MTTWTESERRTLDTVTKAAAATLARLQTEHYNGTANRAAQIETTLEAWDALREVRETMWQSEYAEATAARNAMNRWHNRY